MEDVIRARWEGEVNARISDAERRLDAINGSISTHAQATNDLALKVGQLTVRVGIYAGLGSVIGGAIVAAVLSAVVS